MNTTVVVVASLALSAIALSAAAQGVGGGLVNQRDREQRPCDTTTSVIDSARADAVSVLFSDRPLLAELRHEQGIPNSAGQVDVSAVRDGAVCERMASQFDHALSPGTRVAVLRVGPLYYARDPDQRRTTGLFADSTFHVLIRLGAAFEE
jgi:hypothetical protein